MNVIHAGLGPIGQQIVQAVCDHSSMTVVAAFDVKPALVGRNLGEMVQRPSLNDITVAPDLEQAIASAPQHQKADLLTMATLSEVEDIQPQIMEAIEYALNVVSTAEELAWPWLHHETVAEKIDEAAGQSNVTVVGTGINPGFLLDLLPLILCRPCTNIQSIVAKRIVNVTLRRRQLQKKVGTGLSAAEYNSGVRRGMIGHVGLGESATLLARGLGWQFSQVQENIEPVITDEPMDTEHFEIKSGEVIGSHQEAVIETGEGRNLKLVCRMAQNEPDPRDEITIEAEPPVNMRIDNGIFGDTATAGCTVNILRQVVEAPAGLLSVKDLPVA